jgi:glycosyltransferase involved in cell wall biosynthesis
MTVRDCGRFLPKVFKNIDRLRTLFTDFTLIVAYDHCADDSEAWLMKYKAKAPFTVYLLKVDNPSVHRTVRIAKARNACLEKLETLDIKIHFMIDADDVNVKPWNITLIRYYLAMPGWDVMTFNRPDYYDLWALMYPPFRALLKPVVSPGVIDCMGQD